MKKICLKCKEDKSLDEYNKGKGLHKKHSWCRVCQSSYYKKKVSGEIKRPEKNVCPYKKGCLEYDIWVHMYRFGIELTNKEIIKLVDGLKQAKNKLEYLDEVERRYGCKQENYSPPNEPSEKK